MDWPLLPGRPLEKWGTLGQGRGQRTSLKAQDIPLSNSLLFLSFGIWRLEQNASSLLALAAVM